MGITPENLETPVNDNASESAPDSSAGQAESILDLDTVDRFNFGGREWTPKDLQSAYMMQQDYSKKTQALAEERRFAENFAPDAAKVMEDPSLLSRFAEIYPEKYVQVLQSVLQGRGTQTQKETGAQERSTLPPEVVQKLSKMDKFIQVAEQKEQEVKVQAHMTEIDQMIAKFSPKYPFAKENVVLATAQLLHDRGEKLTSDAWEKIYKYAHGEYEKLFKEQYQKQFNNQKDANVKGRDIAAGGGIPSTAPEKVKLKDVANKWLEQIQSSRG
jgi:hypothetical protein